MIRHIYYCLARWNGVVNATVLIDNELWTYVNTSNPAAESFPQDLAPFPMTQCIGVSATKTGLSADVQHNVTIIKTANTPPFGFVLLFQSFE